MKKLLWRAWLRQVERHGGVFEAAFASAVTFFVVSSLLACGVAVLCGWPVE